MSESYEVPDERLLLRAVANCRPKRAGHHPRWVAVMELLAIGSTYAHFLCRRFGYDPDELIKR